MKRTLPTLIAIILGFIVLADFLIPNPQLDEIGAILAEGALILAGFALLLGLLNLLRVHATFVVASRESGSRQNRSLSVILIIALIVTAAIGVLSPASGANRWIFEYVYYPLQSTMAALLAFFVTSAAYRAFRLKNADAVILAVVSLFLLLAQLPFSRAISPYLPIIRDWIMAVPVTAAMRGLVLGIALGTMATALRVLVAVDKPYMGE